MPVVDALLRPSEEVSSLTLWRWCPGLAGLVCRMASRDGHSTQILLNRAMAQLGPGSLPRRLSFWKPMPACWSLTAAAE